ncbi:MAG: mechanosensitive ion channel [Muribaculaceae bacterium]|nr:mechanosensitive ion channel [Muribaculaceae bacterium]
MILLDLLPIMADSVPSLVRDSVPVITPHQVASEIKDFDWSGVINNVSQGVVSLAFRLLAAIVVFIVGRFIINKLHNLFRGLMERRKVERSLMTFLLSAFRFTFMFILVVTVIGLLGIETSSFIAIFASAGVAVGLALSGTLQNFAGGVLLLMLKPYKVGDYIEFENYKGYVREIQIFHTIIATINNEIIIVPNVGLSTGIVNNYSRERIRRVEWRVSIAYGDDVDRAREVALSILHEDKRVLDGMVGNHAEAEADETPETSQETKRRPWYLRWLGFGKKRGLASEGAEKVVSPVAAEIDCTPSVHVEEMADSAVIILVRGWCASSDYWPVLFDINEAIYKQFPERGLHFPFPQMDVHLNPTLD